MSDECPECKSQDALGCIEPEIYDGILWWVCNGCGCAYVRESKIEYRTHWATKFVNCWNTARDDASETRAALDAAQDENRTLREQIEAQGETLAATCREANDAIEDAQDEIEKLISEKETLRAERDDIQRRFDLTWAYAKPRVTVMTTVQNPASAPGGAS